MILGTIGCTFITAGGGGSGGNPPAGSGYYKQLFFTVLAGDPIIGTNEYQNNDLIQALNLNLGLINSFPEYVTLDNTTGIITRTNPWQEGDIALFPYSVTS